MAQLEVIEEVESFDSKALVDADDCVWVAVATPWWNLANWLFWWLCPADRKRWVVLKTSRGQRMRLKAIRVSRGTARTLKLEVGQ